MGSAFARRVQKSQLRVPKESLTKLAEATKALSNLEQIKQLNDLLGVVRDMTPYLEETRTVCAMLIEQTKGLERRLERQEYAVREALFADPEASRAYRLALDKWDADHPEETVEPSLNGEAPVAEAPQ